jgi:dolichyl-phosphate-mannose--protein O-mannosyl transferase
VINTLKKNSIWIYIVVLTLFSFSIRIYRFTEPNHYYFDEVYHAVTAEAYANNNPSAYDPFAPAPKKGTAYDWLHPPLAKLIQAGSIKLFGDNPAAWRLPSVVFGTALIPATFFLALLFFGKKTAVFGATVIAFENMTLVMSRITMNDVFVTFFIVLSFIFCKLYIDRPRLKWILLTSLSLGLAVGSKWTGFYAIGAIFVFLFLLRIKQKRLDLKIFLVLLIPPICYLLSYSQFWLQGHTITDFVNLHKQIWWYQNRHDLEHSYGTTPIYCVPHGLNGTKQWCPWALDVRGVYFSYEPYGGKNAGYIYLLGNPVVSWIGIIAVCYMLGKLTERPKKEQVLVLLGYFIFWVPWIFSPRIMFLYHYLPSIPFMAVIIGYFLKDIYGSKLKYFSFALLALIIITFFYFYPISTGYPIPISNIDKYMWLKTWR